MAFTPNNPVLLGQTQPIHAEIGGTILEGIMKQALISQVGRYVEMNSRSVTSSLLTGGMSAYFVEEAAPIPTTKPGEIEVKLEAKKVATIVLASREYLSYKEDKFFEVVRPLIVDALARKLDEECLLSATATVYGTSVLKAAVENNKVEGPINGENFDKMIALLNDKGVEPNALISAVNNTSTIRSMTRARGKLEDPLYETMGKKRYVDGIQLFNVHKEANEQLKQKLIAGDFNKVLYGIPYNMTYKLSEDATLTTIKEGSTPVNLFEREMIALRVTMDYAFALVDPQDSFAILQPATT